MLKFLSVADMITLLNAVLGFLSLLLVFSGQLQLAASFILLCLLADGLDGIIARRIGNGKIGEYLETIADVVSLSIAPLALFYKLYYEMVISTLSLHLLLASVLVFSLVCSIIRLASFSLLKERQFFIGLPTSASAIFFVLTFFLKPDLLYVLPMIIVLSLGMISSIHFPKPGLRVNLIAAVFIVTIIIINNLYYNIAPLLLLIALLSYIIFGPLYLRMKKSTISNRTEDAWS